MQEHNATEIRRKSQARETEMERKVDSQDFFYVTAILSMIEVKLG